MSLSRSPRAVLGRRGAALGVGAALLFAGGPMGGAQAVASARVAAIATTAGVLAGVAKAGVDPVQGYVQRVYGSLFDRSPDPSGLATWTTALNSGTARIAVANAITYSTEYRAKLITGSYDHYLKRSPDSVGLSYWLGAMGKGWTVSQMEFGFIASDEYYAQAGSTSDGWVTKLYADVLGRSAAPTEIAHWTAQLRDGARRDQVAMGFLLSTERLSTVVDGYYQHLLGRGIDPTGQATWVGILQAGGRDEAIIGGIIASDEYYTVAPVPPAAGTLLSGQTLAAGQVVHSPTDKYQLVMQSDGNGVVYAAGQRVVWNSGTDGHPGASLVMQADGNAVIRQGATPLWSSQSSGHPGAWLAMQDDGNVVVYGGNQALWSSGGDPELNPAWLVEVNKYRAASGLALVSNNPAWNVGLVHHLNYLYRTPYTYLTGQYQSLHTENPASPYYTADGAVEGGRSNLSMSSGGPAASSIDQWLTAPFHAIGILRPGLTQVAFASGSGYSALDVLGGYGYAPTTSPILFPGAGMTTDLRTYSVESPSPLQTCGWPDGWGTSYGLPLMAMLPTTPQAGIVASVTGPGGSVQSTSNGQLCVVDENTYSTSDTVYGPAGASILQGAHAVVLIARQPYEPGSYTASINQPAAAPIGWTFTMS
jgi:hypothetical protein